MKLEKRTVNSVDLDETSSLIRVYIVCTGIDFGLLDFKDYYTISVELQWLEHHWDHENVFEIWVVRATEG